MKKIGIYKISSLIDDRIYIGSSKDILVRCQNHRYHLKKGTHANIKLQRFFTKYGSESLKYEIIEECELECLIQREQYYIDTLEPYFNISKIAGRVEHSQEFKDKLSENNRNRIWSLASKKKSSDSKKGKTISDEHKEALNSSTRGKSKTEEHKQKISEANKGRIISETTKLAVAKANSERIHSEETKRKLSEASKRRITKPMSEETKEKIRLKAIERHNNNK